MPVEVIAERCVLAAGATLLQELSCKDQEKVAEVSRVRVELQEQIGHLQAERTAQGGLKEKINALERELKGSPSLLHFLQMYFVSLCQFKFVFSTRRFLWSAVWPPK